MDIIINEFSLEEQFENVDAFFNSLNEVISIQKMMDNCSMKMLKHQEIYNHKVTQEQTLHEILIDKRIRTTNELRKFKSFLHKLMTDPPFWQENQQHDSMNVYTCDYTSETHGYSLAEACERDKMVLSFKNQKFDNVSLYVRKNGEKISIINLTDTIFFAEYLKENKLLDINRYCEYRFIDTNISFSKLDPHYGFDILEEEEINIFISSFIRFSEMTWDEITLSDGLEFKKYQPASKKADWFANTPYKDKQIFKFRTNQKCRCFGYRDGDVFYVLRFEKDHKVSDHG